MKILHIKNIAGVATQLRNAQRRLGHQSDILVFDEGDLQYDFDYLYPNNSVERIPVPVLNKSIQLVKNVMEFWQLMRKYDVLHFHGYTIIGANVAPRRPPQGLDLPLWKLADKKIIKHHHGSDIRSRGCPYFQRKFSDLRLASTPDLLKWDTKAKLILNPIVTDEYEYVGVDQQDSDEPITVVHAPTDRKKKGTKYVIEAVEQLQRDGHNVELQIVENTPNEEAIEIYKQADIIADRFKLGWYGVFSIEAMALGKPVLVHIDDEYKQYAPELPVVDTKPDELAENLAMLATDYKYRNELAERGRKFVEEHHDAEAISRQILKLL